MVCYAEKKQSMKIFSWGKTGNTQILPEFYFKWPGSIMNGSRAGQHCPHDNSFGMHGI